MDKLCEKYDSLVYYHFSQSFMSHFTTVKNRILFFPRPVKYMIWDK